MLIIKNVDSEECEMCWKEKMQKTKLCWEIRNTWHEARSMNSYFGIQIDRFQNNNFNNNHSIAPIKGKRIIQPMCQQNSYMLSVFVYSRYIPFDE